MLMIYSNAESWAAMSRDEKVDLGRAHAKLTASLQESGQFVHGAGLADKSLSTTVRVSPDDEVEATDGPFAEAKEHLAGFYVVDVPDRETAVAIAAQMPDAKYVAVEVRPLSTGPEL
jgi:hypothetical protein